MTHEVLTRPVMDLMGCGSPGCTHDHSILFLKSFCHTRDGVEVAYSKADGTITVTCHRCHRFIAAIAVAPTGVKQ